MGRSWNAGEPLKPRLAPRCPPLLLVLLSLLMGIAGGLAVDTHSADAKSTTVVLSGGNLTSPVQIPSDGLLEEAMAVHQGLFRRATEADSYRTAGVYGISYTLEMETLGYRTSGAYFPRQGATPGLWAAAFKESWVYVATPEWDRVLKLYLVAALTGKDVARVPSSSESKADPVSAFDQLMQDLDIQTVPWEQAVRLLPAVPVNPVQDSAPAPANGSGEGDRFRITAVLLVLGAFVGLSAIWAVARRWKRPPPSNP